MPGITATLEEHSEDSSASEIAATARSLKTNLILCLAFTFGVVFLANFSGTVTVLFISVLKGLVLILTTVANFGNIQKVMALYWKNVSLHCLEDFKCKMFSHGFPLTE
jgi:hypothetical protein